MIAQASEELVWSQIVAKAWCDEKFMNRLLADPRGVLAEHDLEVPDDAEVEVTLGTDVKVEGTYAARCFVLPANPPGELFEEQLGGETVAYCYSYSYSGVCGWCGGCACRCRCYSY
jgi:hypothetical protein